MHRRRTEAAPRPRGFRAKGPGFLVWDQDERALRAWASELRRAAPLPAALRMRCGNATVPRHEREGSAPNRSGKSIDRSLAEPSHPGIGQEQLLNFCVG